MLLNNNDFKVNGIDFTKYITQIEFGYYKLWADDSGRNLAGTQSGTPIGIFPKFKVSFRKLNQQELETVAPVLDSASQDVSYYDPNLKRLNTIETYTGDWSVLNRNTFTNVAKANEAFDISFIAVKKR